MDYKGLIERLKRQGSVTTYKQKTICGDCKDAAIAIETLLAERDAALLEIPKDCSRCIHWGKPKIESPCRECWYSSGPNKNWKWRGPKKEDKHEAD